MAFSKAVSSASSSAFTAIRIAWNTFVHNTLWVVGHFHHMTLINIGIAFSELPELRVLRQVVDGVGGDLGRAALEHLTAKGGRFSAHGAASGSFSDGGALEITLPCPDAESAEPSGQNLIWRVRIVGLSDREIMIDQPSALGQTLPLEDGLELIAGISVGQNRWMFHTKILGHAPGRDGGALRIEMPSRVERCQRRSFYRISTVGLVLPGVECWPVLDPSTVPAAETACRARVQMHEESGVVARIGDDEANFLATPEVGPAFPARLVNIGGGGVGLIVEPQDTAGMERRRLFWLAIGLRPHVPAPVGVAARLAHTHIDSEQRLYAGMAFEFGPGDAHKRFVIDRIFRCVNMAQREQMVRRATGE